ncbi:hypothetical protein HU200_032599 [Digitaria exilis]|uniref:Sulfotransferase n=1 Tax=Digitaria exilis TaxID=1010633 RepID=A0A835BWJ2_9POAL|nr:hypothetical protein HU200_032599 [Digitaria exilis]
MSSGACFTARPSDILVVTLPKFRHHMESKNIVPRMLPTTLSTPMFLEYQIYTGKKQIKEESLLLDELPDPRLFATHVPFVSLPATVVASWCKIVYMCRDPKDTLVSLWHFVNKPLSVETAAVSLFCDGVSAFGPYWDHVLRYWHAHVARPEQVLFFFRYEEVWRDPPGHVRRLAAFVGLPFDVEEEENGVVDAIHKGGLQVNKGGKAELVVGRWGIARSSGAARRIDAVTEARFKGSGLNV